MACNAAYCGALQLVSQTFLLGLQFLSSPGCKRPSGHTVRCHLPESVGLQPCCRAQTPSGGRILIFLRRAFWILLICWATLHLIDQIIHTSKATQLENGPHGRYSGNSKRVQTNIPPRGIFLFIVVSLLGKDDKILLWSNERYLKSVGGMASSKCGSLSASTSSDPWAQSLFCIICFMSVSVFPFLRSCEGRLLLYLIFQTLPHPTLPPH